ncbi:carboxyl-terminal processing protease, partial [Cupriavidus gilardii J11]
MRGVLSLLLCLAAPATGIAQSVQSTRSGPLPPETLRAFADTVALMQSSLVEPVSAEALLQAAMRGMLREVDPEGGDVLMASELAPASATQATSGVGLELTVRDGSVVVVAPLPDAPAARAGIAPKDILVSIDGQPVRDRLAWAVKALRGDEGSKVALAIRRGGGDGVRTIEIERKRLPSRSP